MTTPHSWSVRYAGQLKLPDQAREKLRAALPDAGVHAVAAIREEVPVYAGTVNPRLWTNIQRGVALSLGTFIDAATGEREETDALAPAIRGAYELGRGEAEAGRTVEGLHAAYRVGSRAAWVRMGDALLEGGATPANIVVLAGAVFAYTDQLALASAAGHAAALDAVGRERARRREELALALLRGDATPEVLTQAAERAEWVPPETLTSVLIPNEQAGDTMAWIDARSLAIEEKDATTFLVPDVVGAARDRLLTTLRGRRAVLGPTVPWLEVDESHRRALRLWHLVRAGIVTGDPADTEAHLASLIVHADEQTLDDLRKRVLAPLDAVRPTAREKLLQTLRSWLLHALAEGRRDSVAEDLFVHPQTIRYRVGQLRELFGDRLEDPDYVRDLVIALT